MPRWQLDGGSSGGDGTAQNRGDGPVILPEASQAPSDATAIADDSGTVHTSAAPDVVCMGCPGPGTCLLRPTSLGRLASKSSVRGVV